MDFGERLGKLMRAHDVKPRELAKRSGLSQRYISALLAGERKSPTIEVAIALAGALGVSLDALCGLPRAAQDLDAYEVALLEAFRSLPGGEERLKAVELLQVYAGVRRGA